MANVRSQRLRGSLGDSWGDAEFDSDGGASIRSASDFAQDNSDLESEPQELGQPHLEAEPLHEEDVPTPLPPRVTRASSRTPQQTPVKAPKMPRNTRSRRNTPRADSLEPSFIMPSPDGPYDSSPLRQSKLRHRQPPTDSTPQRDSTRRTSRRIPSQAEPKETASEHQALPPQDPWAFVHFVWTNFLRPVLRYFLDILGYAAELMKPIFGFLFVVLVLFAAFTQLGSSIRYALSPVCLLPGSSYILPFCASGTPTPTSTKEPQFEDLMNTQSVFEEILTKSAAGYTLPHQMKSSEAYVRDLKTVVRYSKLPSKSELEVELQAFVDTAKLASRDLIKFNSRVGGAGDRIVHAGTWTLQVMDGIADKEASKGLISHLNPLYSFQAAPKTLQEKVFDQYIKHCSSIQSEISPLIQSATALLDVLDNLQERLDSVADIARRDGVVISENHDELLSQLWTKLGGNKKDRKSYENSLAILKQVITYRETAYAHVTATLIKLQTIAAGLEDLQERVAEPAIGGISDTYPLEYHINVIKAGVDRLREVRGETRQIEEENIRRILDGALGGSIRVEGPRSNELPGRDGEKAMPTVHAH